ncbi:hypothetical protein ACFPH6_13540 [Streptomyces xiangluensis]|uniref:Uncharacterized protein n=1 Tax=Streptomyces xiangluensis TaxID=2665720 RepID=A0ABV8YQY5_9ACTN
MKFLDITLIVHAPAPVTGLQKPPDERFREVRFGHSMPHLHTAVSRLTGSQRQDSLEPLQSEVAPVLRRGIPAPPFAWGPVLPVPPIPEEPAHV